MLIRFDMNANSKAGDDKQFDYFKNLHVIIMFSMICIDHDIFGNIYIMIL